VGDRGVCGYGASVDLRPDRRASGAPAVPAVPAPASRTASALDVREAVEVRRSARRRRTVTAYRENGRTIVLIPAAFSAAEERRWVDQMVAKLQTREERRRRQLASDTDLLARATTLSQSYFAGRAAPASVRWVDNQNRRWGSCTPSDRTIRLSSRLRGMPEFVVDYVLVHELAHLIEASHDQRFWALVHAYPQAERALGFLEGVEFGRPGTPHQDDVTGDGPADDVEEPGAAG
jgi:predicted metal-dependent hydrolase